jgi:hypothetical protein
LKHRASRVVSARPEWITLDVRCKIDAADRTTHFLREITAQFDDDCGQGLWTWLPLTVAMAARAAATFARLPRATFLRAADAMHLTCAQEHGIREIYTNDRHMSAAGRHFRLKALTVAPGE